MFTLAGEGEDGEGKDVEGEDEEGREGASAALFSPSAGFPGLILAGETSKLEASVLIVTALGSNCPGGTGTIVFVSELLTKSPISHSAYEFTFCLHV